jgi:hypothetical protein
MALHHRYWRVIEVLLPISNNIFDVCRMAHAERVASLLAGDPALAQQRTPMGNTPLHVVSQAKQNDPDFNATVATMDEVADYMSERIGGD